MLQFIRNFIPPLTPIRQYHIPDGLRVYAVGDIHGRADLLRRLHVAILDDAAQAPDLEKVVVYLGDYLDRGMYVRDTLEELAFGLPDEFQVEYLRGNHEQIFLAFLDDPSLLEVWLGLGGQATLLNYGVKPPGTGFGLQRAIEVREALLEAMPWEHIAFLKRLKTMHLIGDNAFVHAGIRPGVTMEKQVEGDLLWIRDEFLASKTNHGVRVIHGHTIHERPRALPHRICIDTGAYATGVLSCAVLEGEQVRFMDSRMGDAG